MVLARRDLRDHRLKLEASLRGERAVEVPAAGGGSVEATDDAPASRRRAATGIAGLDDILGGGFPVGRMYLVEGEPGSGKTTLALQFLLEGARRGEPGLYVALSETEDEVREVAESHGWCL